MATVTETFVSSIDKATATSHAFPAAAIPAGKLAIVRAVISSDTVTYTSVTDTAGNTWALAVSQNTGGDVSNARSAILYSVLTNALSGSDVITINLSATAKCGATLAYFDSDTGWVAQASVLDKTASQESQNTTAWSSTATATTTQADELLVGLGCHWPFNGSTSTPGAGWTEESDITFTNLAGFRLVSQWQKVVATGTYAATGTWVAAEYGPDCIATFKTAAGAVAAAASYRPVRVTSRFVGPMALRRLFQRPYWPPPVVLAGGTVYAKAGDLLAGAILSGTDVFEASKAGSLLASGVLSGADVFTTSETGSVLGGSVISAADVWTPAETGALLAGGVLAGADAFTAVEAGSLLSAAVLTGADVFAAAEAGSILAKGSPTGADVFTASETGAILSGAILSGGDAWTAAEAGALLASGFIAGADVFTPAESGSLLAGSVLSGADVFTASETGSLLAKSLLAAADSFVTAETGALLAGGVQSGADVFTAVESGSVIAGSILSGASVLVQTGNYQKAGSLLAGSRISAADAATFAETGSLVVASFISGSDATSFAETGKLLTSGLLAGADVFTAVETGSLLGRSYLAGSAAKTTEGIVTIRFGPPSPSGGVGVGTPDGGVGPGSPTGGIGAGTPSANRFGQPSPGKVRT